MELFYSSGSVIKKLYQNACATDVYNLYSYICKKKQYDKNEFNLLAFSYFCFPLDLLRR